MNDPQFVEAARHLAENTLKRHRKDRKRVEWMLFSVLCRPASKADRADALAAISDFRGVFEGKPKAAQALIETGDSNASLQEVGREGSAHQTEPHETNLADFRQYLSPKYRRAPDATGRHG